jgi:hypothetical protein
MIWIHRSIYIFLWHLLSEIKKLLVKHNRRGVHNFCHRCVYKYDSGVWSLFSSNNGGAKWSISPFYKIHYTQIGARIENYWLHAIHIIHIDWTIRILTLRCGTVHHFINHCLWLKIRWCLFWSWSIIDIIGSFGYATIDKTLFNEITWLFERYPVNSYP